MDRDQKAAAIAELTDELKGSEAIFAVDYRGISVTQASELRRKLADADAVFKVVKNRLAKRAVADAGADEMDALLVGPTALTLIMAVPKLHQTSAPAREQSPILPSWKSSMGGGTSPQWGAGSKEILYISANNELTATPLTDGQTGVTLGAPRMLFPIPNVAEIDWALYPTANTFVAAADGQRFLVAVRAADPSAPPMKLVVNWYALLNR